MRRKWAVALGLFILMMLVASLFINLGTSFGLTESAAKVLGGMAIGTAMAIVAVSLLEDRSGSE